MTTNTLSTTEVLSLAVTASGVSAVGSGTIVAVRWAQTDPVPLANSRVLIAAPAGDSSITGQAAAWVNRLSFAEFVSFSYYKGLGMKSGVSIYSLFNYLRDTLGITLSQADVEETVSYNEDGQVKLLLQAKSQSPGWYGSAILTTPPPTQLSSLLRSLVL